MVGKSNQNVFISNRCFEICRIRDIRVRDIEIGLYYVLQKAKALIAKKEEGNKEFRSGKYENALNLYTEALSIDPHNKFTNSKLYNNRATVCSKVNKPRHDISDK